MYLETKELFVEPLGKPRLDEVGQCLMRAAQIIRERGWCQGVACDETGAVCLVGAIYDIREKAADIPYEFAKSEPEPAYSAYKIMERRNQIGPWNDEPRRTAEEVIAALEAAALTRAPAAPERL